MIVAIAKLGNPAMVGQYAYALAIVAPLVLFLNLQLRAIQATDVRTEFQFGNYFAVRLITIGVTWIVVFSIIAFGRYDAATSLTLLGVTLTKCLDGISDIFYGYLQRHDRMDYIAWSTMIKAPLSLFGLALGVYFTNTVYWGTLGSAIATAAVTLLYDVRFSQTISRCSDIKRYWFFLSQYFKPRGTLDQLKQLILLAAPMGIGMMLISLQTNIPRYFLEHKLGEAEVGIFSALAYITAIGNIVTESLGQSVVPRLAHLHAQANRQGFRTFVAMLTAFGAVMGAVTVLVTWLAGREALSLLYRPEYAEHFNVLFILVIASGPTYIASFLGFAMTAARLFRIQPPLSALSTLTVIVACIWLIPRNGLVGAAEAIVIVSIIRVLAAGVVTIRAARDSSE